MPTWTYEARSPDGTLVKGVLQGPTRQSALAELDRRSLAPVRVHESMPRQGRISSATLATTLRQLGDLLRAGVPLLRALRLLGRGKAHANLSTIWSEVADAVADGTPLASAMAQHPGVFRDVHTAMVRAGEQGGFLEDVLGRLGELLESQAALRAKVVGSLIYPAMLIVTGLGAIIYALVAFVPKFEPFFDRIEVPVATELLLGISHAFLSTWPALLLLLAALLGGVLVARRRPGARRWLHVQATRIPLLKQLLAEIALARMAQVLGSLLHNGVGLLQALAISRDTAGHPALAAAMERAYGDVQGGRRLSDSLGESKALPEDVIEMIDVAETANTMPSVLANIADVARRRVEHRLHLLLRLLEPMLLLFVAGMVVFIFAALVVPMMRMSSSLQ
jgi:general secretion pathway protein F/type IV pilus assembly protein PilC